MQSDMLVEMFRKRSDFMRALEKAKPGSYPDWPIDVSSKASQKILRELTLRGVEEAFEALQHLKNWKEHRDDTDDAFDREEFLEEFVDALNYFYAVMILVGVTPEELFETYCKKDEKIHNRISGNQ